jgi:DNA-binding IclR family transcriptional regulator
MMFTDMNAREVKSAARVLELLEYLSSAADPVALRDVAATLGIPKSSAHGLLGTLLNRGYVERDATERYALAEAFRHGATHGATWVGGHDARIAAAARPVMEELRDQVRQSVFLGGRGAGGDVKLLAKVVSREPIRYDNDQRGLRPAYCTAMGRVLLAFWDARARARYFERLTPVAHTPYTVTDVAKLRAIVNGVRQRGYAIVEQEFAVAGTATAAPVRDRDGRVIAALNVGTLSAQFPAQRTRIIAATRAAAERIAQRLGYRPTLGKAS